MRFYFVDTPEGPAWLTASNHAATLFAGASKVMVAIDIPTDKQGLLRWLNENNIRVGAAAPAPASDEGPAAPAPSPPASEWARLRDALADKSRAIDVIVDLVETSDDWILDRIVEAVIIRLREFRKGLTK